MSAPNLDDFGGPDDAAARVVDQNGNRSIAATAAPPTSVPGRRGVSATSARLRVAGDDRRSPPSGPDPAYVQYARSTDSLDATISRLWLFLAAASWAAPCSRLLAGMAVAGRAMRPVSALTATAREIAATRDPSLRIPEPETDDEVGELARTLDADASRARRGPLGDASR